MTKVCVLGLWHLGPVTAAALASIGHHVTALDFDTEVVEKLRAGVPPVSEPGLEALLAEGVESDHLRFISRLDDLPSDLELLWVAFDTPVDDDDNANVNLVIGQARAVLPALPANTTVLVSSQLPVGSTQALENVAAEIVPQKHLGFACSPENLRLGKALDAFLHPDRVVVGVKSARDRNRIEQMLAPITKNIEWMSVPSAEMTKHAINAFLATSVVFANEIAALCEAVGADAKEVERGLKSEERIGPKAYLSPGGAFAGGTLARDVEFLKGIARSHGLTVPMIESVKVSNDLHKRWVHHKLKTLFPSLDGITVAIWGLTYKPGTDTLRRSLAVELGEWLLEQGARVRVHDPAVRALPPSWNGRVKRFDDAIDALTDASVLVVGTEWPDYKVAAAGVGPRGKRDLTVIDANRFLASLRDVPSFHYFAVGSASS